MKTIAEAGKEPLRYTCPFCRLQTDDHATWTRHLCYLNPGAMCWPLPIPPGPGASELNGGKLSGDHYYRVQVAQPISPELQPYAAECADIIEALGMTFNEGEAFKALWRLAAARQGRGKPGNKAQYDADKVAHYGARVAACVKRGA